MPEFNDKDLIVKEQRAQEARRERELAELEAHLNIDHMILTVDLELVRRAFWHAIDALKGVLRERNLLRQFCAELEMEGIEIDEGVLEDVISELFEEEVIEEFEDPDEVWIEFERLLKTKVVLREA